MENQAQGPASPCGIVCAMTAIVSIGDQQVDGLCDWLSFGGREGCQPGFDGEVSPFIVASRQWFPGVCRPYEDVLVMPDVGGIQVCGRMARACRVRQQLS